MYKRLSLGGVAGISKSDDDLDIQGPTMPSGLQSMFDSIGSVETDCCSENGS